MRYPATARWTTPLRQFSSEHIAALSVMAVAIGLSVFGARRDPGRWIAPISFALVLVIFAGWVGEYVADVVQGIWSARYDLPLQLTDAVSLAALLALSTRRAWLIELAYFWALTASLQAALTPDLHESFPSVFFFTYFAYHEGAIVTACFLVFGCRQYPRPGAAWRVYAATLVVTALAGVGDLITGGNYMYLREKPEHSSLLNVMGSWPWYILSTAVLGLLMLLALEALTQLVRRRDLAAAATATSDGQ
jgi:hypothetical integral membrane protein (TIGR02206 family)